MKFKLDENFGSWMVHLFVEFGHNVETVRSEQLGGAKDEVVFQTCLNEARCLVSLDLDFADVIRFPPEDTEGIAVLRLPHQASIHFLNAQIRGFLNLLERESIRGRLWIIEPGRIRIREKQD